MGRAGREEALDTGRIGVDAGASTTTRWVLPRIDRSPVRPSAMPGQGCFRAGRGRHGGGAGLARHHDVVEPELEGAVLVTDESGAPHHAAPVGGRLAGLVLVALHLLADDPRP